LCTSIVNAIERDGPLPFSRYMHMALYEPGLGYYVNGLHKFGAAGDFITAPETGSLFAGALAAQLDALAGQRAGDWTLLELGPGSGALAAGLLAALDHPPARYLLLEPSAVLREVQRETLAALPEALASRVEWIAEPPGGDFEGAIVANEVIDALPVERFQVTAKGPRALAVEFDGQRLVWRETEPGPRLSAALEAVVEALPHTLPVGYVSELCIDLPGWIETVTRPLRRGLVLLVDYGYRRAEYYHPERAGGTLVCHYRHRAHFDPFVWPGLTDLSAFVDFTAVAEAARTAGLEVAGLTTQAGFMLGSGVHERIGQQTDERERLRLAAEFKRLVLPGEMGEKFKVMALARDCQPALNRFTTTARL